jgi:hypothetical protein
LKDRYAIFNSACSVFFLRSYLPNSNTLIEEPESFREPKRKL